MDGFSGLPDYGDRKNRCATCGFFALRVPGTSQTVEADGTAREGTISWPHARPECFVGATNLYREVAGDRDRVALRQTPVAQLHAEIKAVVEKERDGEHWLPWRPHFAPAWHVERRDMLQLEQSRRDHDLRLKQMEVDARRSSEQIQRDSLEIGKTTQATMEGLREIAARAEASDKKTDDFMRNWTKTAALVGTIALLGFALQYMFPALGPWAGENLTRGITAAWDWLVSVGSR